MRLVWTHHATARWRERAGAFPRPNMVSANMLRLAAGRALVWAGETLVPLAIKPHPEPGAVIVTSVLREDWL